MPKELIELPDKFCGPCPFSKNVIEITRNEIRSFIGRDYTKDEIQIECQTLDIDKSKRRLYYMFKLYKDGRLIRLQVGSGGTFSCPKSSKKTDHAEIF